LFFNRLEKSYMGEATTDIKDLSRRQLAHWLTARGIRSYRAGQILRWVHRRQADSFSGMSDLGVSLREMLGREFTIARLVLDRLETSGDGSKKYLFRLSDGKRIESVLIPERNHHTLCVSSQVGCALGCRFCLTGKGGLERNLSTGEIVAQVRDVLRDLSGPASLTNLVFMGMGEPLANFDNLVDALDILTDNGAGFSFAGRRITVSTAGIVPKIPQLGEQATVNLAVSLNAADNETRNRLMPINRTYPIEALIDACKRYPLRPHRRITFEYILLKGVNDSEEDARRLGRLLRPVRAKINLIPFNRHEGSPYEEPSEDVISKFQEILLRGHYTAVIRRSKGRDISAACGQLRGMLRSGGD
jgi:23S rRNA (adenine2503-C2)-methyltransferase